MGCLIPDRSEADYRAWAETRPCCGPCHAPFVGKAIEGLSRQQFRRSQALCEAGHNPMCLESQLGSGRERTLP